MGFSPLSRELVEELKQRLRITPENASIREMKKLVSAIEQQTNLSFIKMEFGIPGLPAPKEAVDGMIQGMKDNSHTHQYPPFDGLPELKQEAARFIRLFLGLDIPVQSCIPTVGSMQGGFIAMAIAGRAQAGKDTILFLDPGFPVNKIQARFLGLRSASIDVHDKRGDDLLAAVEQRLQQGDIAAVLYSNPNNPAWIVFNDYELHGLGALLNRYQAIAIEDLAYFAMDFREDYSVPGRPPYPPTIANHTDLYFLLISSSKVFSLAGERVAIAVVSPKMWGLRRPDLLPYFNTDDLGYAFIHGGMYPTTSGVPQSSQRALLAVLQAVNNGERDLLGLARTYGERAKAMKAIFLRNGFYLVYDNDMGEPLADGFYFTLGYPGMNSSQLINELLLYGISAISLGITGSHRDDGIRACVSLVAASRFQDLEERVTRFYHDHPTAAKE